MIPSGFAKKDVFTIDMLVSKYGMKFIDLNKK